MNKICSLGSFLCSINSGKTVLCIVTFIPETCRTVYKLIHLPLLLGYYSLISLIFYSTAQLWYPPRSLFCFIPFFFALKNIKQANNQYLSSQFLYYIKPINSCISSLHLCFEGKKGINFISGFPASPSVPATQWAQLNFANTLRAIAQSYCDLTLPMILTNLPHINYIQPQRMAQVPIILNILTFSISLK